MKNRCRKLVCMGMVILMTLSSMPVTAWAEPVTPQEAVAEQPVMEEVVSGTGELSEGDYQYKELEDDTVEIVKYTGSEMDITVPADIGGKTVTSIGNEAFSDCGSLGSVKLLDGVTSIGDRAFAGCGNLSIIELSDRLTSIGDSAFYDCSSLSSLELPSGVTNIGAEAFYGCSNLSDINLPGGLTSIGDSVFSGCSSLSSIELPSGVTSIEMWAFYGCSSLSSIELPSGVTSIGRGAFSGCSNLSSIELPKGVTSIGNNVFYGCSNLVSVELSNGITSIGDRAFYNCGSLSSIELPSGVTSIGNQAFSGCSNLNSIELPSGVTSIGNQAFSGCSNLNSIELPNGLTNIGRQAFSNCSSLKNIVIGDGLTAELQWDMFSGCDNLSSIYVFEKNVKYSSLDGVLFDKDQTTLIYCPKGKTGDYQIPAGVTTINANAFHGCDRIKCVEIPSGVVNIGSDAFSGCTNLEILCDENSYAHTFAVENNIAFQLIVKYTIAFDTNGGDALDQTSLAIREGNTLGELQTPTRTGYIFKGWFTEKTGGNAVTKDTIPTADMTIYAQWEQVKNENDSGKPGDTSGGTPDQPQQKQSLEKAVVTIAKANYAYDGKAKKPAVSVTLNGKKLAANTDYKVTYQKNKNIGTATVTITGAGNYTGTVTKTFTISAKKGTSFTVGAYKYKITNSKEVAFAGIKSTKTTKVVIPKTVKIGGKTFSVTSVAGKALYKKTKVTSVTIGANVKTIGASAFAGCKKLSTITINTTKLKSVGKNAFKGIKATAKIKVPSGKLKAYKKILKSRGQGRKVKIVKK